MNWNDANVTLMNQNDSSGLIKISHDSSAQDKPEGPDTELAALIILKPKNKKEGDKRKHREKQQAQERSRVFSHLIQGASTRFIISNLPHTTQFTYF